MQKKDRSGRIAEIILYGTEHLIIAVILLMTICLILNYIPPVYDRGNEKESERYDEIRDSVMEKDQGNRTETKLDDSFNEESPYRIRVRLTENENLSPYQQHVEVRSEAPYTVTWLEKETQEFVRGKKTLKKEAGERFFVEKTDLSDSCILRIEAQKELDLGLQVCSLSKADGIPCYEGILYVYSCEEGLVLINDLPLERYLCSVVSSEMPSYYPLEAQKAQAVCARTYAWKHMKPDKMEETESLDKVQMKKVAAMQSDLDDSILFQVYNNYKYTQQSCEAVHATAGQLLPIDEPLYYSTSCLSEHRTDLAEEISFRKFLEEVPQQKAEFGSTWLRWSVIRNAESLIPKEFNCTQKNGETVPELTVLERTQQGQVQKLEIRCGEMVQVLEGEYDIRCALGSGDAAIQLADGSMTEGMQILPSAFFVLEYQPESDSYRISGGGYGHGTGMSQCGAAQMAEEGSSYQEILNYYYGKEATALWSS